MPLPTQEQTRNHHNMKTAIITLFTLLCIFPVTVQANDRTTLRDSKGRITGSAVTQGSRIILRDNKGRLTGSVTIRGSKATIRNGKGQ